MARANLAPGVVIDGFRVEEQLHRGGMAEICVTEPVTTDEGTFAEPLQNVDPVF